MEELIIQGVTKSIVHHLRMNIIEGKLAPGQRLNEVELSSQLGISRPPLREAFRILENENLIINIPRKGCFVSELSKGDCRQIYKTRELIECGAVDCLKERNVRDLPEVAKALDLTEKQQAISSDDNKIGEVGSRNPFPYFHIKLVESTRNNWLIRFYNMIAPTLARYQFMCYVPEILGRIQEEHKVMFDLITKGEYDSAKQLLKKHIDWYVEFIGQMMKENGWEGAREPLAMQRE
jgi:DNA-binding GntR family transcriptional regulator